MELEITFGIPADQRAAAVKILYEAFPNKFGKIFGPPKDASTLIAESLREDRIVVALHKNEIVGVGGLKFEGKKFLDIKFWPLLKALKCGIVQFLFWGWIFEYIVGKNELLIDALAVTSSMRSRGIGKLLMDFIIDFARSEEYQQVTLLVIDTNKRAQEFYRRIGFKEMKFHKLFFPLNKSLGFNGAIEMGYPVKEFI